MIPANAPTSRSPSIAILTTPTRSEMTPDSAPKISGVEIATVDTSVEVSVTAPAESEPAYSRKPRIVDTPTTLIPTARAHDGTSMRRTVTINSHAVTRIVNATSTHTMGAPDVTISGIEYDCDLSFSRIVTSPCVETPNTNSRMLAATYTTGSFHERLTRTCASFSTVLIRRSPFQQPPDASHQAA